MGWILVLIVWLIAPFAELAVIIVLLVANDNYKNQIRRLQREQLRNRADIGPWGCQGQERQEPVVAPVTKGEAVFGEAEAERTGYEPQWDTIDFRQYENPEERRTEDRNPEEERTENGYPGEVRSENGYPEHGRTEERELKNRNPEDGKTEDGYSESGSSEERQKEQELENRNPEAERLEDGYSESGRTEKREVENRNLQDKRSENRYSQDRNREDRGSEESMPGSKNPEERSAEFRNWDDSHWNELQRPPFYETQRPLKRQNLLARGRGSLGTLALVMGVIFIVLAGLIFATTTWHILPDICKTFLVLACSVLFFGASLGAERVFRIRKTSHGLYILGSVFLFLSVLAAAYFRLLGPEFILEGQNRWKVLWVGSIVTVAAFLAGLKRFHDTVYTQTSLWGMTVSLFFMARALGMGWDSFVFVMMGYSAALMIAKEYPQFWGLKEGDDSTEPGKREEPDDSFGSILIGGFRLFAPIHFWTFAVLSMLRGLFPVWLMLLDGCMGYGADQLLRIPLFSFTVSSTGALVVLLAGICVLERKRDDETFSWLRRAAALEAILYGAGWAADDFVCRMAVVNAAFGAVWLAARASRVQKEETSSSHSLFWDICACAALTLTLISFYADREGRVISLVFCLAAFAGYYLWFYFGSRQWPHLLAAIAILPLPWITRLHMGLTAGQLSAGVGAVLLLTGIGARCFYPIVREDAQVQGGWRMDWYQIFSVWTILWMAVSNDGGWRFAYLLLAALYFLQYQAVEGLRKPALSLSAVFAAAAFWQQPFILWPDVVSLELSLLPVVWLIWTAGRIWDQWPLIRPVQNAGYLICLLLLAMDAILTGLVWDALILEGICLGIFVSSQIKNHVWWARISAGMILAVALFMTRSFWLSISWWVYLLAAGIGLIGLAAFMEKKP